MALPSRTPKPKYVNVSFLNKVHKLSPKRDTIIT